MHVPRVHTPHCNVDSKAVERAASRNNSSGFHPQVVRLEKLERLGTFFKRSLGANRKEWWKNVIHSWKHTDTYYYSWYFYQRQLDDPQTGTHRIVLIKPQL